MCVCVASVYYLFCGDRHVTVSNCRSGNILVCIDKIYYIMSLSGKVFN